jgi:hypothetical protein
VTPEDRNEARTALELRQPARRIAALGVSVVALAVVLQAAAAAPTVAATASGNPPAGFVRRTQLERIATEIAGRPVELFCARNLGAWSDFFWVAGGVEATVIDEDGLTQPALGTLYLPSDTCRSLLDRLSGRPLSLEATATAILALVHESEHLAGISNESTADCTALPLVPIVAIEHFHYASTPRARHRQLHNLVAFAWDTHRRRPSWYQTLC